MNAHAVLVTVSDRPGMLFGLTGVLASHQANITYVDMHTGGELTDIYFEFTLAGSASDDVLRELRGVPGVVRLEETPSLAKDLRQAHHRDGRRRAGRAGGDRGGGRSRPPQYSRRAHFGRYHSRSSAKPSSPRRFGPSSGCRGCGCSCWRVR